jgi:transposase
MGTSNYSDEFKQDAVHQIVVRGYPVREVSRRLGVSTHSLYKWMKLFGEPSRKTAGVDHEAENRRLKRELARVTVALPFNRFCLNLCGAVAAFGL